MDKQVTVIDKPVLKTPAELRLIAESIRLVRGLIVMTIDDATAMLGVSKQSLNDLEKGRTVCRVSALLIKVVNGLGINLKIELPKV